MVTSTFRPVRGPDGRRHALVLSGGGAEGAFEIGVLAALVDGRCPSTSGQPLRSNIFCGSSIGAFHGGQLAAHHVEGELRQAVERLVHLWRVPIARSRLSPKGGIFRFRGVPDFIQWRRSFSALELLRCWPQILASSLFWGQFTAGHIKRYLISQGSTLERILSMGRLENLFDIRPFSTLLQRTLDLDQLARRDSFLAIALTHFGIGTPRVLFKDEITDVFGLAAFEAAIAVPGLVQPTWLAGKPYVDGGLSMTTPFLPAIVAGADVLHVMRAWPPPDQLPPVKPDTFETLYRLLRMLMFNNVFDNLHSLDGVSKAVRETIRFEQEWMEAKSDEKISRQGDRWHAAMENWSAFDGRGVDIHFYHLSGGRSSAAAFLDFRLDHVDQLMGMGFNQARNHDCRAEGCLLAGKASGRGKQP